MTGSTNTAAQLIRESYGLTENSGSAINPFEQGQRVVEIHPDIEFSLFGLSGTKETGRGADAYYGFISSCLAAIADRSDEILDVMAIDDQCVFVRAQAWRKSAATGEELHYQWSTLMRIEDGMLVHVTDMLDRDAQEFWGRIAG
jgi:ketosteroid isomerase-like protein